MLSRSRSIISLPKSSSNRSTRRIHRLCQKETHIAMILILEKLKWPILILHNWKGSIHTHLLHAHFSAHSACTITFAHFHACHTHAWLKFMKRCLSHECLCSLSRRLPSHFSPVSAVPVHPLRHPLPVRKLAVLSRPKSAGQAQLRTCIEEFGYLTKSDANTHTPLMSWNFDWSFRSKRRRNVSARL